MKSIRDLTENFVYNIFDKFSTMVYENGEETEFYGIKVMKEKENFVRGTIVNSTALLYIHYAKSNDERSEKTLKILSYLLDSATNHKCNTWGKLSILRGLTALYDANLLDNIDSQLIEKAKISTDYSDFLDKTTLNLIGYPSNYLQVALACAALREKLGFENDGYSKKITARFCELLKTSADGWMDEAPPYKRFDRYSFIVSSELSDTFLLADLEFDDYFKKNLRLAAEHCLFMANKAGDGWNYGRSLSCHGDCAIAEILSSAMSRGLLTEEEKPLALAYCSKITEKTLNYWFDKSRDSFNIWWDGRSTNGYRQVHRVMQVGLDMGIHLLSTLKNLTVAGVDNIIPDESLIPCPEKWVYDEIIFSSDSSHISEAIVLRRGNRLSMLPLIGLGSHIANSAYMPYPAICTEVESAPEGQMPFLVPEYTINSKIYRPCQYFKSISIKNDNDIIEILAKGNLCEYGEKFPKESDIPFEINYSFNKNEINVSFFINSEYEKARMVTGTHSNDTSIIAFGFDESRLIFENPNVEDYKYFNINNVPKEERYPYQFMTPHGFITEAYEYTVKNASKLSYKIILAD